MSSCAGFASLPGSSRRRPSSSSASALAEVRRRRGLAPARRWCRSSRCAFLAPAVVGLLIANRQPRNRIAWILLLGPLALTMQLPLALVLERGLGAADGPGALATALRVADRGRRTSSRTVGCSRAAWRWVGLFGVVSFVGFMALALLDPEPVRGRGRVRPEPASRTTPSASGSLDHRRIWVPFWLGILATPHRRRRRDDPPASAVDRGRAAADDVARLVGCADSARTRPVRARRLDDLRRSSTESSSPSSC